MCGFGGVFSILRKMSSPGDSDSEVFDGEAFSDWVGEFCPVFPAKRPLLLIEWG